MKFWNFYKKLHIGLYLCFMLSILVADFPLRLFESYSLIDSKSIKSLVEQLAFQKKEEFKKSGAETFNLRIDDSVEYRLKIPDVSAIESESKIKLKGNPLVGSGEYAFQLSTAKGLVDVQISNTDNGSFSISFVKNFEKKALEKYPFLNIFKKPFVVAFLCVILALRLIPVYRYNFFKSVGNEKSLEKNIIGLPLFMLSLAMIAGLVKLSTNMTGCYVVQDAISGKALALFSVSFILYAALASLLTLGFTQEYINKYIASPFFKDHDPYVMRRGSSINLFSRFLIIIFSVGMAPTALGLYLPLSFNAGLLSDVPSLVNILDNFEMMVPILIMMVLTAYFFIMQIASMFSFRKNIIVPINNLIGRMKLVADGDFKCKTSVLYVDEIGQLKGHFNSMLDGLIEREAIKDTFGRFMSIEIAKKLLKEKKLNLMGEEIEATVLFSDIRDFTSISEKLSATELVEFLNIYFSHIVKPIHAQSGVVNKFIGDAVMAVFAPIFENLNHEESAVRAALDMKSALLRFNALNKYPEVKFGVGIHRGKLVAGNIGTKERMEYTFIGDNVNIASRIESETKNFKTDILISEDVVNKLQKQNFKDYNFVKLGPVMMKGKSVPLELYGVTAAK